MTDTDTAPATVRDGEGRVVVPLDLFSRWVSATATAADKHREPLAVIRFEPTRDGEGTVAAATDSFSLVALRVECRFVGHPFVVPAKELLAAVKQAGKDRKGATPRTVTVAGDGTEWAFVVSDGTSAGGAVPVLHGFPTGWRNLAEHTTGFAPATFSAVTFGVVTRMLDRLGGMCGVEWTRMEPGKASSGWVTGGNGVTGMVLAMPLRRDPGSAAVTL